MIQAIMQRRGVRQLIKFCIVGATSTVVDKGTLWFMLNHFAPQAPWWVSATVSFCFGVTNGFVWNRRWTFRAQESGRARTQYIKFVLTNLVGLILNLSITKMFLMLFTGQVVHGENPTPTTVLLASICAIPFVVIWNFSAAKYWTFREPKAAADAGTPDRTLLA